MKFWTDIFFPKRWLTDFGDPLARHPVTPTGQSFHISCKEVAQYSFDRLAQEIVQTFMVPRWWIITLTFPLASPQGCGFEWNVSTTIGWIVMKFGTNITHHDELYYLWCLLALTFHQKQDQTRSNTCKTIMALPSVVLMQNSHQHSEEIWSLFSLFPQLHLCTIVDKPTVAYKIYWLNLRSRGLVRNCDRRGDTGITAARHKWGLLGGRCMKSLWEQEENTSTKTINAFRKIKLNNRGNAVTAGEILSILCCCLVF